MATNSAPVIGTGTPSAGAAYAQGEQGVILDSSVFILDMELDAAGTFDGSTLTISRHGGANAADTFSPTGTLAFDLGELTLDGAVLGSVTNEHGVLSISFESGASPELVQAALRQIAYADMTDPTGTVVQLDWRFDDGSGAANAVTVHTQSVALISPVVGTPDGGLLNGTPGADYLVGLEGKDVFTADAGNDTYAGGAGLDTLAYTGKFSDYTLQHTEDGRIIVTDHANGSGVDIVDQVERLLFGDINLALDIDGNAGMAYRLYQAAFDRTPDIPGLGYQMHALDTGLSLTQVAANFIASPEFQGKYGSLDNVHFVTQLYANVLHREPEAEGLAYHVHRLESGATRADVLIGFSESPENQANVIGAIEDGMLYIL